MLLTEISDEVLARTREFLSENIFGEIPGRPVHLSADVGEKDKFFAAGKAILKKHNLICELEGGKEIKFPITAVIPKGKTNIPVIISAEHEGSVPSRFLPIEEIVDRGYAVFCFNHKDVSENGSNFKEKIYQRLATRRKKNAPGKIAIWAYAITRIAEYVCDLDFTDKSRIIASGHSFLGKSALLAAAFSDKIKSVIANDSINFGSPCAFGSPAISYPYMFCPRLSEGNNFEDIKNEHYALLLACSDKTLLIGASKDGLRSSPEAELDALKRVKAENPSLEYHFHSRDGSQYFSRNDWNAYLDYLDKTPSFDNSILHF